MGPLELLEKLINEHGSAAILREQLALVRAEYASLERERNEMKAKAAQQQAEIEQQRARLQDLQARIDRELAGPLALVVCEHCAGRSLTRTGTRPHPLFGAVGTKEAILRCNDCGRDSFFELPMK